MLSKAALEIILDPGPGFSSRLFLVEKIAVAWRPVINLSHLNEFVLQSPFMIETVAFVLQSIREGDFLASVDLSDAYFLNTWSSGFEEALVVPVGCCSLPDRGPVLWNVDCPSGLHQCVFAGVSVWAPSHRIPLLGYLDG